MHTDDHQDPSSDLVPFFDLAAVVPAAFPRKNSAAWLLRHRDRNGLAHIIRFVGRRPVVSKRDFLAWVRNRPAQPTGRTVRGTARGV